MVVSMTHPHDPYAITREYWDRFRDDEIDMPRITPAIRGSTDPHCRGSRYVGDMDDTDIDRAAHPRRAACLLRLSALSTTVGRVMGTLEIGAGGQYDGVLTSDHGDFLGERGLWYKMSYCEHASRVPLIVHAPRHFAAHRVAASVSSVDLLPTLAELAHDGAAPGHCYGDRGPQPAAASPGYWRP